MNALLGNEDPYMTGMTPLQKAYTVGRLPDLPLGGIECVAYFEFSGRRLDHDRLQRAVDRVHRHPALRCVFRQDGDRIVDGDHPAPTVTTQDVTTDPEAGRRLIRSRMMRDGIDIGLGRNWDVGLSVDSSGSHVLHIAFALAAVDVVAIGLVLDELAQVYRGQTDHIDRGREPQTINELDALLAATARPARTGSAKRRNELAPLLPGPDLVGVSEMVTENVEMMTLRRELSASDWRALEGRARRAGVSTAALVLATYEHTLRCWSERRDFSLTVASLDVRGTEDLVADRTVPLAHRSFDRADFDHQLRDSATGLRRLMVERRDALTEVRQAQARGESAQLSRFVFTYGVQTDLYSGPVRNVFGRPRSWGQTPQSAIDCRLLRVDEDTVEVAFDVRRAAVPDPTASAIFELFGQNLLEVAESGRPQSTVPHRQAVIRDRLNASDPHPGKLLYDDFRVRAAEQPDAIAIAESSPAFASGSSAGSVISYAELDRRALALAGRLTARIEPGTVVAVQLPRGIDQVVAILAILYAGGAYLPLSTEVPPARVDRIQERSGWSLLITDAFLNAEDPAAPLAEPQDRDGDDLAYIIFTSGSTGEPKGVAITHRSAMNTITDINGRHHLGCDDVLIGVSGIDFDLSVYDIFGTLAAGARLITITDAETRDPFRWGELVRDGGVTVWNSVPMLLEMLEAANADLRSLRLFLVSGDRIPLDLPERSRALSPGSIFVAMGGATEGSIWSNEYVIATSADLHPDWPSVPYGRPLTGQQYRVVDRSGRDRPDGCVGELLIGGAGVARDYYRDPNRTDAAFTGTDGRRWYHTGDLGWWHDGLLFFAGRRDTQVKIRGHRVECAEVEARLVAHPGVSSAAVVPIRERSALGAIVVTSADRPAPPASELDAFLSAELPWYMVPTVFEEVDDLPMTNNGKVDRDAARSLLDRDDGRHGAAAQEAAALADDALFRLISAAWARSLDRPVDSGSNYFALGGDSLAATRMCAELRAAALPADLAHLFRAPVLAQFVAACRARRSEDHLRRPAAPTDPNDRPVADWPELAAAAGASLHTLGLQGWCRWLWCHELHRYSPEEIADDADFFALGGDSLTAARLCADLRRSGVDSNVATLFRHPKFGDFWPRCQELDDNAGSSSTVADADEDEVFDLTPLQLAYALGSDGLPGVVRTSPGVAVILHSDRPIPASEWSAALSGVVARHEVLRLVRSNDWRQRVVAEAVPEFTEIPHDISEDQFREVLRRTSVNPSRPPAVRGFVTRNRPGDLGLVFNYLALDSLSVATILGDLAAVVVGGHPQPPSDITAFRSYAAALIGTPDDPARQAVVEPPPAPVIPIHPVPEHDVVFGSSGWMIAGDDLSRLGEVARSLGVTVNSLLLQAYGSAVAAATGQPRLTVNVPTATRPLDAPDALGQFTDLVLCECGDGISVQDIHQRLGTAMSRPGTRDFRRTPDRQRYPVVFTSLLGSPLAQDLADGRIRTSWTHTRTPAVLIDCQITPMAGHGIEVRWDFPLDVVDREFIEPAFDKFVGRLLDLATEPGRDGHKINNEIGAVLR